MFAIKNSIRIYLVLVILIITCTCNPSSHLSSPPKHYNILQQQQPLTLKIKIFNSTDKVFNKTYPILYSLETQPQIHEQIQIPIHLNIDNFTIIAQLFKENMGKPIQIATRNLTRFAKVRKNSDFTASVEMEGVSNKVDENTRYGLHLPERFVVMPIHCVGVIPHSIQEYVNFFNFKAIRRDKFYYVPPIDLSQLHIPFKTYKYLNNYIKQQAQLRFLEQSHPNLTILPEDPSSQQPINNTQTLHSLLHEQYPYNLTLIIRLYPFNYFQMLFGLTNIDLLKKNAPPLAQDIYTEDMIDMMKQMFFENNFYFVVLYFVLSVVQCFMQFFAFKNQIKVWQSVQKTGGLSIKSLYQWLFGYVVMLLYLIDQEANVLYMLFMVLDIVITVWKILKAIQVRSQEGFPYFKFGYKEWYHNKTESADSEATHYTSKLIAILFTLFMLYKLYPPLKSVLSTLTNQHQSLTLPKFSLIYSFILQSFMGFFLVFGFVMITPQLYINYKLKSVDHLPWKTLIYRFISTIIDDIFVFMISLPWLQRAFSFRDDIVFVIYLVQRRMYRVDRNRLAVGGGSVDLTKITDQDKLKLIKGQAFSTKSQSKQQ